MQALWKHAAPNGFPDRNGESGREFLVPDVPIWEAVRGSAVKIFI